MSNYFLTRACNSIIRQRKTILSNVKKKKYRLATITSICYFTPKLSRKINLSKIRFASMEHGRVRDASMK